MRRLRARAWAAWQALWRGKQLDAGMSDEMRFHVEMETQRLMREQQLDAQEARRRARIAFGGVEKFKDEGRRTLGLHLLDTLALDFRLGARMLVKYKGLTLVGGFAMAVAIAIGATFFEVVNEVLDTALPIEDGNRVVSLQYVSDSGTPERRILRDFQTWREELVSVQQLSAFRTVYHNLIAPGAAPEALKIAEMTASGFAVARTQPLLGRYLLPRDESEGALPVIVLSHQAWQSRFGSDPLVLGRAVQVSGVHHMVVGVMPEGFKFPVAHQFWIPLRERPLKYERFQGPALSVFGRLAPGATMESAQAELTTINQRSAPLNPATNERLRLVAQPFTREHIEDFGDPAVAWAFRIAQLLVGALTFAVAINLAILMYARTVSRLGEMAVRTALGASRRRILGQLFIEAFALSLVAAAAGLLLSATVLSRINWFLATNGIQSIPFWIDFDLSMTTILYAVGLAALAAVIVGVLPGLKATGSQLHVHLRELGRSGPRLGGLWTSLVISQVAVAVTILPAAVYFSWQIVRTELAGPGFAAEKFVVGAVTPGQDTASADANRARARRLDLISRLAAEPGVSAVTSSSSVPGFAPHRKIEFEPGTPLRDAGQHEVSSLDVSLETFSVYGVKILAGRGFNAGDLGAAGHVVVNRSFQREFLEDRSALGVRFRYTRERPGRIPQSPGHQVVGVVNDFPSLPPNEPGSDGEPTVYHPAAAGDVDNLSVRFHDKIPEGFPERFRQIGAEVDPALQLRRVRPLADYYAELRSLWRFFGGGIALVTASVLLLSAAGIYALLSFTVAQRTREIGIRAALGAAPNRLLLSIFGRATRQLALGVLLGSLLSGAVLSNINIGITRAAPLLLSVAAIMLIVGLLAAFGPARRGLRIQPSEALRLDA
jgi:predicted permease